MISNILAPYTTGESDNYRLPLDHQQAILARSDSALVHAEIERKRQAFIKRYGNEFGTSDTSPT